MRTGLIAGSAVLVVAVIFIIQNTHFARRPADGRRGTRPGHPAPADHPACPAQSPGPAKQPTTNRLPADPPRQMTREKGEPPMSAAKKRAPGSVLGIRSWRHRMAGHVLRQRVEVSDDDRTVATAEVTTSEGSGGTARVSLRAEPGHINPGRRASLVDAVLDLPEVQQSSRLEAAFRLGDGESLHRLEERCEDVSTRSAGWSALLDAGLPSRAGQHVPDSAGKEPLPGA